MSDVDVEVTIVFEKPSKDERGYLRRMRTALELSRKLKAGKPAPEDLDNLVSFLLPFIKEPVDRAVAEEALWDASEEEFQLMLGTLRGSDEEENPPSPPGNDSA
jgi:hypothetical protein